MKNKYFFSYNNMILFSKQKKGNVIFIVIAVFTVLALALGSLLRTTLNRKYSAQKLVDTMYARELANSLASLTVHYLKEQLKDSNGSKELKKSFSHPWNYTGNDIKGSIDLSKIDVLDSESGKSLIETLKSESNLKDIALVDNKIYWKLTDTKPIRVGDEKEGTIPYPREKTGLINISFKITYKQPGKNSNVTEEYNYASDIKVVANLIPVLSKFTLYIEDLLMNDSETDSIKKNKHTRRFNVIDSNVNGDLNNTTDKIVKPWILNNTGENEVGEGESEKPKSYSELVRNKRGFVYLGGGSKEYPIRLGIACGDVDMDIGNMSEYGEDFHFFRKPESEGGFFKALEPPDWGDDEGVLCANIGLCNDNDPESGYKDYLDLLGDSNYNLVKLNSLFKLYGTDEMFTRGIFSPTLVLGYVDSMYASIRIYKTVDDNDRFNKLNYYETPEEFFNALNENETDSSFFDPDLNEFKLRYELKFPGELDFNIYHIAFSSRVESLPYNNDYTYAFKRDEPFPFHNTITDEELENLCDRKSDDEIFVKIPNTEKAQYGKIYGDDVKDLTILKEFLDTKKLSIFSDGKRIAYSLKLVPADKDKVKGSIVLDEKDDVWKILEDYFKSKGILLNGCLDLNGWIYIDTDDFDEDFKLPLKLGNYNISSHGGIVLSKGNISIEEDIKYNPNNHLTLLTLGKASSKGNIIIKSKVTQVNASLISKNGHIYLEDDDNGKKINLDIYGNIVMHNPGFNSKNNIMKKAGLRRGLRLNYKPELSAIPNFSKKNEVEEARSECNLLMFNIKDNPKSL